MRHKFIDFYNDRIRFISLKENWWGRGVNINDQSLFSHYNVINIETFFGKSTVFN